MVLTQPSDIMSLRDEIARESSSSYHHCERRETGFSQQFGCGQSTDGKPEAMLVLNQFFQPGD